MWLTTDEAARASGYHVNYIRKLIRTNRIKARRYSTLWQVDRASLLAYIQATERKGAKRGPKRD